MNTYINFDLDVMSTDELLLLKEELQFTSARIREIILNRASITHESFATSSKNFPEDKLDIRVADLDKYGLDTRTYNALRLARIFVKSFNREFPRFITLRDVINSTEDDLMSLRNFGTRSMDNLCKCLIRIKNDKPENEKVDCPEDAN